MDSQLFNLAERESAQGELNFACARMFEDPDQIQLVWVDKDTHNVNAYLNLHTRVGKYLWATQSLGQIVLIGAVTFGVAYLVTWSSIKASHCIKSKRPVTNETKGKLNAI
mgnify:CR=1 FL=1